MKIGLLAGTGKDVGLGHLKRCLSIAKSLSKLSNGIEFIIENEYFNDWIRDYGFPTFDIHNNMEKYDLIIVDKYWIDEKFLHGLKKKGNFLARIDDAYSPFKDQVSDIVINCNPYANEGLYKDLLRKDCHLILGRDFVPMEDKFCLLRQSYEIRSTVSNITITFGGSENMEFAMRVCERISTMEIFTNIYVLNGTLLKRHLHDKAISRLTLLPLVKNVEDIFALSDIVICSASTTCWQLSAIGIPFFCFQIADNQKHNFEYIKNMNLGVALEQDAINDGTLETELTNLTLQKRRLMYLQWRNLIDCRGSERIATRITQILDFNSLDN
jgi:spore coat polysaccharide biosynthesis predicted glycosyltransferase SpsG